jgi:hypothetical protein
MTVQGQLTARREPIHVGMTIPIRINPDDPNQWTDRSAVASLTRQALGVLILVPLVLLAIIGAVLAHRRIVEMWRDGLAWPGIVVQSMTSALAPRSQLVRCARREGRDQQLVSVFIPHSMGTLQRGDELWLVSLPSRSNRALAAMVYEEMPTAEAEMP